MQQMQSTLAAKAKRFSAHEPVKAFETALVLRRLTDDGSAAIHMLATADRPASLLADLSDARLWALALEVAPQALPERWPEVYAEALLSAPVAQLDALAAGLESAGRSEHLVSAVKRALDEPAIYIDLLMWLWRGPTVKTSLPIPPETEFLTRILDLVGPVRQRGGASDRGADATNMRSKIRAGLGAGNYARFRRLIEGIDESLAIAIRRQIERAEGLGPVVQQEMVDIVREHFPALYARARVARWDEDDVIYVTSAGLKRKEKELNELVNVKMRENAKAIGAAAEHGDLSENSEYKFALEERDLLRARVAQINREMSMARVLEADDVPDDHVSIGHRIVLESEEDGSARIVTLLGPWESDLTLGIYSYQTPLARRMLGCRVGDSISLPLEDGGERAYRITRLEVAIVGETM
jgi:transcription elongation factor GreA